MTKTQIAKQIIEGVSAALLYYALVAALFTL